MLSYTQTSSNKLVKLHLVRWIIWIVWWCTDSQTSNDHLLARHLVISTNCHAISGFNLHDIYFLQPRNRPRWQVRRCVTNVVFLLTCDSPAFVFSYLKSPLIQLWILTRSFVCSVSGHVLSVEDCQNFIRRILSVTQENAVDLHSVGRFPQYSRRRSGGKKHADPVKNISFYHCTTFFNNYCSLFFRCKTSPQPNLYTALTT